MPPLYIIAVSLLIFVSGGSAENRIPEKVYATCYGYSPCNACTSCNYCKHCKTGGGTCGVCKDLKSNKSKAEYNPVYTKPNTAQSNPSSTAVSTQCRAITKKGTRCSRSSRSKGYCWQHGG